MTKMRDQEMEKYSQVMSEMPSTLVKGYTGISKEIQYLIDRKQSQDAILM